MATTREKDKPQAAAAKAKTAKQRRAILKKLGRFAAVSAPAVTLLLAATAKPGVAQAASCAPVVSSRVFKSRVGPVDPTAVLAAVAALPIRVQRG
jgi:hypothetical protein